MPAEEPQRRTQKERRDATRAALLDAALACLCDGGLAGFTTPGVCARAALSQGALFRHFPTKASLLAATAEHLFAALRAEYEARFSRLPASRRTPEEGIRLLFRSMKDERLAAAYELYTAARTDPDLRDALGPIVRAHVAHLRNLGHSLMPTRDLAARDRFEALVDLSTLAMQGLVIEEMVLPDLATRRRLLASLGALAASSPAPRPRGGN